MSSLAAWIIIGGNCQVGQRELLLGGGNCQVGQFFLGGADCQVDPRNFI